MVLLFILHYLKVLLFFLFNFESNIIILIYFFFQISGLQIENNTAENIEAIYTTLALLCVELASEETLSDMLQFVLGYL